MTALHLEKDGKIGRVIFDCKDAKVNTLSTPLMLELEALLHTLKKDKTLDIITFESAKKDQFIAGADIHEIESITTEKEGFEKARMGQSIFDLIAELPVPTVAIINGPTLGGGLELALACTFRIATSHPKVIMGLPEVQLGILPGFGGTQRLPKCVGIKSGLDLILAGKVIKADKAYKMGLVDELVHYKFLKAETNQILNTLATPQGQKAWRKKQAQKRKKAKKYETVLSPIIFQLAKKNVLKQTKGHYPAPLLALESIKYGHCRSLKKGLEKEAELFSKLAATSICKNLVRLFFIQEALKKDPQAVSQKASQRDETFGVLGAGLMGGGIAQLISASGFPVRLKDIQWPAIGKGIEAAYSIFAKALSKRKMTPSEVDLAMDRISGTTEYDGFEKLDVIVEAVVENIDIKKSVFKELEAHLKETAIIASNTSALSITEMSSVLNRPENFIGMHFFSPVHRMPLVEIIPGEKTSQDTIARIVSLTKTLKKTPIVVQNCSGFLVNRILIPYVNEAIKLIEEGESIEMVDAIATEFGMPLGPLALADEVGLDVGYKVAKTLEKHYGERMALSTLFENIKDLEGCLGKKTGKGFYIHQGKSLTPNPEILRIIHSPKAKMDAKIILDRLILTMVNEAGRCLEENVVASEEYLDMAMIMGTGFPPFRGGLCAYVKERGVSNILQSLDQLETWFGPRFSPADYWKSKLVI